MTAERSAGAALLLIFLARAPRACCRGRSRTSTRSISRSACASSTSRSTSRIRPAIPSSSRCRRCRPRCCAPPASTPRRPRAGDLERARRRGGDSRASSCSSGASRGATAWRGGRHARPGGLAAVLVHRPAAAQRHARLRRGDVGARARRRIRRPRRTLVAGALLAGLAVGIRSQTAVLTVPALAIALMRVRNGRHGCRAVGALAAGVVVWAVPLHRRQRRPGRVPRRRSARRPVRTSRGVVMLWTHLDPGDPGRVRRRTRLTQHVRLAVGLVARPRRLRAGGRRGGPARLAGAAPAGARCSRRSRRTPSSTCCSRRPTTIRYALPLLPVIAYAAMAALEGSARTGAAGRRARHRGDLADAGAAGVGRTTRATGRRCSARSTTWPRPRTAATASTRSRCTPARGAPPSGRRRFCRRGSTKAPHGHEWLTLVALWKAEPAARVWFAADPGRTRPGAVRSARAAPRARLPMGIHRTAFRRRRPARRDVDWYDMQPPTWMLDRGWSVTAEVGGVTARDKRRARRDARDRWLKRAAAGDDRVLGGRHHRRRPRRRSMSRCAARPSARTRWRPASFCTLLRCPRALLTRRRPTSRSR